jgi:prepilin signal peptidase PulO-like enzyme (type II secretory pathway)
LRGRCRTCQKPISWQYPIVEILVGLLFLIFAYKIFSDFGTPELWITRQWLMLIRDWFLISIFTIIFIMDLRWYVILDAITWPAIVVILIINLALGFSWLGLLISATIGVSFFLLQFIVSRGLWLGGGDIRLGLLLGVALGWPYIVAAIFLAYGLGALVGLWLLATKKRQANSLIPLGTFLTVAALIILLYGPNIINWYLHFINWR